MDNNKRKLSINKLDNSTLLSEENIYQGNNRKSDHPLDKLIGSNKNINLFETIYENVMKTYNTCYNEFQQQLQQEQDISLEFEIRIGGKNLAKINKTEYIRTRHNVLRIMKELERQSENRMTITMQQVKILEEDFPDGSRKLVYLEQNEDPIWQKKIKQKAIIQEQYNFRVGIAYEYNIEAPKKLHQQEPERIVLKNRTSFIIDEIVSIDFTEVIPQNEEEKILYNTNTQNNKVDYQIELEWKDKSKVDLKKLEPYLKILLMFYNDTSIIMSETEKTKVSLKFDSLLGINFNDVGFRIPPSVVNKPKDLHFKDLSTEVSDVGNIQREGVKHGLLMRKGGYAISIKADGIRKFLYYGDEGLYLINPPYISKISTIVSDKLRNTIFDGELIDNNTDFLDKNNQQRLFVIFDILHDPDKGDEGVFYDKELNSRIKAMKFLIKHNDLDGIIKLYRKEYYIFKTPEQLFETINVIFNDIDKLPFKYDGLIFTPVFAEYNQTKEKDSNENPSIVRKWKDIKYLTIDFEILLDTQQDRLILLVGDIDKNIRFEGTHNIPYGGQTISGTKKLLDEDNKPIPFHDGQIIEFLWDIKSKQFEPIRIREDKAVPNFKTSANDVWNLIHNPIPLSTLQGKDMILMRKYHNRVKRDLLSFLYIKRCHILLDIGSGKGGDADKWSQNQLQVFAVEPRKDFIQDLLKRLQINKQEHFTTIINTGGEDYKTITKKMNGTKADAITLFNSLTFFYESEEKIQGLITTITTNLKHDGYLILIAMDGSRVNDLLDKKQEFKTINTHIKRIDEREIEIVFTGSSTVNEPQNEFLIDFNDLIRRLQIEGFHILTNEFLNKEYFLTNEELLYTNMYRKVIAKYTGESSEMNTDIIDDQSDALIATILQEESLLSPDSHIKSKKVVVIPKKKYSIIRKSNTSIQDKNINETETTNDKVDTQPTKSKSVIRKLSTKTVKEAPQIRRDRHFQMLAMDEIQEFGSIVFGTDLVRIGVIPDGSCFFHSILKATSPSYRQLTKTKRMLFCKEVRKDLAELLTQDTLNQLGNGIFIDKDRGSDYWSLERMKKHLNSKSCVGTEVFEYVANTLGLDIYLLWDGGDNIYLQGWDITNMILRRKSVILYYFGNNHYELVGRKVPNTNGIQLFFSFNDPLIELIYSAIPH